MPTDDDLRPLFIPLLGLWFDAFERGDKQCEWRRFGPRWHFDSCWVGRAAVLSRGYSGRRLAGRIRSVRLAASDEGGEPTIRLFGAGVMCIVIGLHEIVPLAFSPKRAS